MRILHLSEQDYKVGRWSGGTTTELFIWPEGADYARREFAVRISSALVDLEESDFTPLPGVTRFITPLSGAFTLTHPDGKTVHMAPLDTPYRFCGDTPTHCAGKATDFNLMLKGVRGEMRLASGKLIFPRGLLAVYAPQDREFTVQGRAHRLCAGELLVVFAEEAYTVIDLGTEQSLACYADV